MLGLPDGVVACVFDLDGVLTTSATMHALAWAETFDPFLLERAERSHREFVPFDRRTEYQVYIAGRPRLEGVRGFLGSRGIGLPEGDADDPAGAETMHALANRKNQVLQQHLDRQGVAAFSGSRFYLEAARSIGVHRAVVSASANTAEHPRERRARPPDRVLRRRQHDRVGAPPLQARTRHADRRLPPARRPAGPARRVRDHARRDHRRPRRGRQAHRRRRPQRPDRTRSSPATPTS